MEEGLRDEPGPWTLEPGLETILADILKVQQNRLLCVVVIQRYCLIGKKKKCNGHEEWHEQ